MRGNVSPQLRELMDIGKPANNSVEDEDGLPTQADDEYQAYSMPANKPLVSLHFITPDGQVRSFQYRHLDSDSTFEHSKITLRFLGFRPMMIVIEGQSLWQLYDYLHQDRCRWIKQAARDFSEPGYPLVRRLTFIDLTETVR